LKGEDVIKCKSAGCKTGWVSVKILESKIHNSEMTHSTTPTVLDWSTALAVGVQGMQGKWKQSEALWKLAAAVGFFF
jgi:hypothetical protein